MSTTSAVAWDPYQFDESWYRGTYGDVDAAIIAGNIASAHDHYIQFGRAEGRFPCARASDDRLMARGIYADDGDSTLAPSDRQRLVGEVWSNKPAEGWYWMAHPMVRARLNKLASGNPEIDSYARLATLLRERQVGLPLRKAVSLGCGFGALERDLAARGILQEVDAYDIAPGAITEARRLAEAAGFSELRYHVADLEVAALAEASIDVVLAHQSVHHVERLDSLFSAVAAMLKPDGIFHLHEYVGPNRFQWTETQVSEVNKFLSSLPPDLRRLPSGQPRPPQGRATIAAMIAADPSEAIRSEDIIPKLRNHFTILEERPLGGTLLHLALADIAQNFDMNSPRDCKILTEFFEREDRLLQDGTIKSDFTVITATQKHTFPKTRSVFERLVHWKSYFRTPSTRL